MMYPPSCAMDATAASGGPITILPQIMTGSPQSILGHVAEMVAKAQQFATLIEDFTKAEQQLGDAWSGHAADSALIKMKNSLEAFTKIVNVIERGSTLLKEAAALITTAQTAYRTVVGAVNPTVAGLMSNPWTYGAAVALSTGVSAALRAFINAVSVILKALGAVKIAGELATLVQIIQQLEQLFNDKHSAPTSSVTNGSVAANAITAPNASGSVASASGQQLYQANGQPAYQGYTPAALAGLPNSQLNGGLNPYGYHPAGLTNASAADSWLAVDPQAHSAGMAHDGDEIVVTTIHGDTTTTVEVPLDGETEVKVAADGTVTVT